MLYVEANIFQYILFTMSNICKFFHKPSASNWIILKIFDTSPFIISNIHYQAAINIYNFLIKNKKRMNKYDKTFLTNRKLLKEYEKYKKYLKKIISRLYDKNLIDKNIKENNSNIGFLSNSRSILKQTSKEFNTNKLSSNLNASKYKSIYSTKNIKLNKNITICINENILDIIEWDEFKDVIIKYLNKYLSKNDNDKFSFIQFGIQGLITKSFLSQSIYN